MAMTAAAVRQGPAPASAPEVPFVRGSREFSEGPFIDITRTPGSAAQAVGPFDIPARGWMSWITLQVDCSGGVLGSGVLHEDYPFSLLDQVLLSRPNGDPYVGPLKGFSLFLANVAGGYWFDGDPRNDPDFVGTINASYVVRVPVEITHHDAFGALINQDAAAAYKLSFVIPAVSDLFTTAPTTAPTVRVRAWLEGWEQPPATDLLGRAVAQSPPGTPTAQFWSEQTFQVVAGLNTIRLTDVGNLIRTLILVLRTGSPPARSSAHYPQDSLALTYDARRLLERSFRGWRRTMHERYGVNFPTGVVVIDFTHDGEGHSGEEARNLYLPTTDATRLEIVGSFGAAGVLTVITNDVSPSGVPVR
jgi:hypothetical protein